MQREKEVEERRESAIRTEDVLRQDEAEVRRKRSQSVVSTISTDTVSSLPPNYSQLESRTESVRSLDTRKTLSIQYLLNVVDQDSFRLLQFPLNTMIYSSNFDSSFLDVLLYTGLYLPHLDI